MAYHLLMCPIQSPCILVAKALSEDDQAMVLSGWLNPKGIIQAEAPDMDNVGWYCVPDSMQVNMWWVWQVFQLEDWQMDPPAPNISKKIYSLQFLQEVDL